MTKISEKEGEIVKETMVAVSFGMNFWTTLNAWMLHAFPWMIDIPCKLQGTNQTREDISRVNTNTTNLITSKARVLKYVVFNSRSRTCFMLYFYTRDFLRQNIRYMKDKNERVEYCVVILRRSYQHK